MRSQPTLTERSRLLFDRVEGQCEDFDGTLCCLQVLQVCGQQFLSCPTREAQKLSVVKNMSDFSRNLGFPGPLGCRLMGEEELRKLVK